MTPAPAPKSSVLPQNLNTLLPDIKTPWNINPALFNRLKAQASDQPFKLYEVSSSEHEYNFILKYFEHQKPAGYSIRRVVCIHNPDHTQVFEGTLKNMEREANNHVFAPKGKDEEPKAERAQVLARWEAQASQFSPVEIKSSNSRQPDTCSRVKVLPLWHGSSREVCQSVCSSGFTSFGKHHYFDEKATKGNAKSTDKGYFGAGIYFTNSAQYATMYSSGGHLLLAWVSMREPYPVVNDKPHPHKGSDMLKLEGRMHYQNYNAHFIPVASIKPQDPQFLEYYPCYKDQPPAWDEFVVFYPAQALPRFWIELGVDFPNIPVPELCNNREFSNLLTHLLDQPDVKKHADLSGLLQTRANKLIELNETAPLNAEDQKLFRLTKQLMPPGEKISPPIVNMILKSSSSPASASPISSNTPSPKVPQISMAPTFSPIPLSLSASLAEEDYQQGCIYRKTGDLKQAFLSYQKAAEKGHSEAQYQLSQFYRYGDGIEKNTQKAEEWCRKAAAQGHLVAQGVCYYYGYGVVQNYNEAVKWYRRAADQGNANGQYCLGTCYYSGEGVARDYKEAIKWYRKAADQGDTNAQGSLGTCYYNGQGVAQDDKEAVKWYQKAADQGNVAAQYNLGLCYYFGKGVAKDFKEAIKWYQKAADQGNIEAQYGLGVSYYNGRGVAQDYKEAIKWFQKAADQGHAGAQYSLGLCYNEGFGVARDDEETFKWYLKAADQGHVTAQFDLGVRYYDVCNYKEAVKWFQKAAEQGHTNAQYKLGACYAEGHGVTQNYKEAIKWFQKAADKGYAAAQGSLGYCYDKGLGVAQNHKEAVKWYQKAADQGDDFARGKLGMNPILD